MVMTQWWNEKFNFKAKPKPALLSVLQAVSGQRGTIQKTDQGHRGIVRPTCQAWAYRQKMENLTGLKAAGAPIPGWLSLKSPWCSPWKKATKPRRQGGGQKWGGGHLTTHGAVSKQLRIPGSEDEVKLTAGSQLRLVSYKNGLEQSTSVRQLHTSNTSENKVITVFTGRVWCPT